MRLRDGARSHGHEHLHSACQRICPALILIFHAWKLSDAARLSQCGKYDNSTLGKNRVYSDPVIPGQYDNSCCPLLFNHLKLIIMLLLNQFSNPSEFEEVFGIRECGNGNKTRKNKILLSCLKNRDFVSFCAHDTTSMAGTLRGLFYINTMSDFKCWLLENIERSGRQAHGREYGNVFHIDGEDYNFYHPDIEIDNHGVCMDGDIRSVRYINNANGGRIFKMKAGKFLLRIMDACPFGRVIPEQGRIWLCEEFSSSWQAFAMRNAPLKNYNFHYGNSLEDFEKIYSSRNRRGDFHSCMTDKGYHSMYFNACKCHAAWLTDAEGQMFARCVVFDEVHDHTTGETLRLAERQYSDGVRDSFKKQLVDELISRGLIDGYKQIGAGCSDNQNFVLNDGTSICDHLLSIDCKLDGSDKVSYMDSFVYYSLDAHTAYNDSFGVEYSHELNSTDGWLDELCWSEYHGEYIPESEACYVERVDDFFYREDVVIDHHGCYQLKGDCVRCAVCDDEWYLRDEMIQEIGLPDDLYFCDSECAAHWASEHGYVWSDTNVCYIYADDAVAVNRYYKYHGRNGCWQSEYIFKCDFEYDRKKMHELNGEWYWLEDEEAEEAYKNMTLPALVVA